MRTLVRAGIVVAGVTALVTAAACSGDDEGQKITLTGQALQDPNSCIGCHADAFREWSGSMHAYAAEDPVFLAMNKRMLRETNGASKDFCVGCHAPVALRLGLTQDGSNLAELPASVRGVTCYFCHTVNAVADTHNNPLKLANDDTLRGAIKDPAKSMPHKGVYSALHDRETQESSQLCGACHDVVTPHGAKIERTFEEWKSSLYAKPGQLSCGKCHMEGRSGKAASSAGVGTRTVHDHSMAAVDIAVTPFFGVEDQKKLVQRFLDNTILTQLCVQVTPEQGPIAAVTLDNAFAGHGYPSGANQDRRAWVELIATKAGAVVFSSGTVEDRKAASKHESPNYWLLRDKIFKDDGTETHLFWEAARVEPLQLPPAVTGDPLDPKFIHSVTRNYQLGAIPDSVKMRVRMRPLDFDLLDDLVSSGDLDPAVLDKIPTWDLASGTKEWTTATGLGKCVK